MSVKNNFLTLREGEGGGHLAVVKVKQLSSFHRLKITIKL